MQQVLLVILWVEDMGDCLFAILLDFLKITKKVLRQFESFFLVYWHY